MKKVLSMLNLGDIVPSKLEKMILSFNIPKIEVLSFLLSEEEHVSMEEMIGIIKKNNPDHENIKIISVDVLNNTIKYSANMRDAGYVPGKDQEGNLLPKDYYFSVTVEEWEKAKKEDKKGYSSYATGPIVYKTVSTNIW